MAGSRVRVTRLACLLAASLLFAIQPVGASPSDRAIPQVARYADADGDGIGDEIDPDDDNDGILDIDEVTSPPPGPEPTSPPQLPDTDGDGIPNDLDPDDNNDGVPDDQAGNDPDPAADADGDGISDALDPDDDNDGISDEDENAAPAPTPGAGSPPSGGNQNDAPSKSGQHDSAPGDESELISGLPVTGSGTESATNRIDSYLALFVATWTISTLVLIRRRRCFLIGAGPRAG